MNYGRTVDCDWFNERKNMECDVESDFKMIDFQEL